MKIALIVALLIATPVFADTQSDRTVAYCAYLFKSTGEQRNDAANEAAQLRAQLAMAQDDIKVLQAQIAVLEKKK